MPALVCLGDATTHGDKVISASSTMFINGIQVALVDDLISCPIRHIAINILSANKEFEAGLRRKMRRAGMDRNYLPSVLAGCGVS